MKIHPVPYKECNEKKYIEIIKLAEMLVVWLNFESLLPDIYNAAFLNASMEQNTIKIYSMQCEKLYTELSLHTKAKIVWFSFEDYFNKFHVIKGYKYNSIVDKLNIEIHDILNENNVSFINLKQLIAEVGVVNAYDTKGKYRWNAPYSKALIEKAVKAIHKQYLIEQGVTKKCLVLRLRQCPCGAVFSPKMGSKT